MLRLLKHAEAMALDPKLREALGNSGVDGTESTPANPALAEELQNGIANVVPTDLSAQIPAFADDYADATR